MRLLSIFNRTFIPFSTFFRCRFADAAWRDSCFALKQTFQFCGVGSHHQNGIAERRIRDLSDIARASLLHAIHHWPDGVTKNLWPFALKYACLIRNRVRASNGHTPEELFASLPTASYIDITQFHPFGCPVYVLDACLQNGNKIPTWGEYASKPNAAQTPGWGSVRKQAERTHVRSILKY